MHRLATASGPSGQGPRPNPLGAAGHTTGRGGGLARAAGGSGRYGGAVAALAAEEDNGEAHQRSPKRTKLQHNPPGPGQGQGQGHHPGGISAKQHDAILSAEGGGPVGRTTSQNLLDLAKAAAALDGQDLDEGTAGAGGAAEGASGGVGAERQPQGPGGDAGTGGASLAREGMEEPVVAVKEEMVDAGRRGEGEPGGDWDAGGRGARGPRSSMGMEDGAAGGGPGLSGNGGGGAGVGPGAVSFGQQQAGGRGGVALGVRGSGPGVGSSGALGIGGGGGGGGGGGLHGQGGGLGVGMGAVDASQQRLVGACACPLRCGPGSKHGAVPGLAVLPCLRLAVFASGCSSSVAVWLKG